MQTWCYFYIYRMSCCKSLAALFACFASCVNNGTMSSMLDSVRPGGRYFEWYGHYQRQCIEVHSVNPWEKKFTCAFSANCIGSRNIFALHCLCYAFCFQFCDRLTLDVERILSI